MPIVKPKPSIGTGSVDLTSTNDRLISLEESIGEIRVYTSTAETWPSTLKPGEPIQYLSSSGNVTTLTINGLPATLTAIWIAGRKQAAATSVVVKDIRRATARILDNQLIIECGYTEANTIWSIQTTASGVYSSAVQGLPNMREALRRWRFRVQFVLATQTTAAQFLTDAQTTPLANYTGPNGAAIATEPTLDLLRFTPFCGTEVYSSATVDPTRVIPAGTYISYIVGTELYLIQTSEIAAQPSFSRVADISWFDTAYDPRYLRKVSKGTITSLTLEYKQANGTVRSFSLTDFTTGFSNSGFWNGSSDPNGRTRFVADAETVVVSWDGSGENLTLAVVTTRSAYLQIRKVRVNGQPLDWLSVYEPPISTPASILSYKTETLLDTTPSLTSETYLQLTDVPPGNYLAFFRLTMNLTTVGSRHWCCGVGINNAAVSHATNTHAVVSVNSDTYTVNYPHVANGSTLITLPNPTNTVEVKGQLYGTDHTTGESIVHGHLTLIKL